MGAREGEAEGRLFFWLGVMDFFFFFFSFLTHFLFFKVYSTYGGVEIIK